MMKRAKKIRSKPSSVSQIALATTRVDWSQWDPWAGWQGLIGVAVCLAAGFFYGTHGFWSDRRRRSSLYRTRHL
jgi:hypothetical protein